MRFVADRTFRLNWNSDRTRAKMIWQAILLTEDHKPVAGLPHRISGGKDRKIERVCVVRENRKADTARADRSR